MKKYDVVIVGAGTGGLSARKQVAQKTDNYIVVDNGILGTTCARVGCMPSKVLIQVANDFYRKNTFSSVGIHGAESLSINHTEVMKHVRKLRDRFVSATMTGFDGWQDTHLIRKKATLIDKNTLDLEGERVQANKIIVATGSRPILPAPWKNYKDYLVDTNAFFELENLPPVMAVIGLGVIGIELGQALHRLGVKVIAIGKGRSIGGLSDPEMIDYVSKKFAEEMDIDYSGVESLSEENGKLIIQTQNRKIKVDKALVAIGRQPNIDKIGLKNIEVSLNEQGLPHFNTNTMQIEGTNIFIAGDANGDRPLLHEAADDGAVAGYNAQASEQLSFKRRTFLGITFSDPNIAVVGKGYSEIKRENIDFVEGKVSFEGQGRSIVKLKEKGLLKVYADAKSGLILGAEIFVPSGEHLAHLLSWAIQKDMTVYEALSMPFYHPVIEEGLRTALRDLATKIIPDTRSPLEIAVCQDHPTNNC